MTLLQVSLYNSAASSITEYFGSEQSSTDILFDTRAWLSRLKVFNGTAGT